MLLRADIFSALAVPLGIGLALQGGPEATLSANPEHDFDAAVAVSFASEVMPILEARCTECHSAENAELGLNLSTYEGLMAGSDYGTVVEPGNPDASLIIDMIQAGDMPEDGDPVPADELELLKTWIAEGAENN